MKKILMLITAALVWANIARAQTDTSDLISLGVRPEVAETLETILSSGIIYKNNTYLKFRNNAGSANVDVLRVDTTDATRLNANATLNFAIGGTAIMRVTGAGLLPATDGDNATANLGSSSAGFKNFYMTDATNDASFIVSNGLYINYPTGQSLLFREGSTTKWTMTATSGDLAATAAGATIAIQEATAGSACSGTLTATGATPVVTSTTCAKTGSRIFLQRTSAETGAVNAWVSAISDGVSFSVTGEAADTGAYNWIIFHEAA